ncbi:DNA repair protein XRCC3-like [Argopecten irradians]|uniref:DNA repair protein XRCC3-like n=1 Tax=Argopecten irradians TaxID=31199 RepID=UPI00371FE943
MENLDINPRIIAGVKKAGLKTYESILSLTTQDIQRSTNLSSSDVQVMKTAVAQALVKSPVSALDILHRNCPENLVVTKLTTGCDVMDTALRGGILSQGITEIAGESASGKTQFCLQLCLTVQLPAIQGGLGGGRSSLSYLMVMASMKTGDTRKHVPALGLTWANQVMCRIMLSRTSQQICVPKQVTTSSVTGGGQTCVRELEVIYAPHLPMLKILFIVDEEGIKALT